MAIHNFIMGFIGKNDFLTVQEVSELLKLSVITLYKYIRENKLEAVEFGGHYRIAVTSLEKFINDHKVNRSSLDIENRDNLDISFKTDDKSIEIDT